MLAKKHLSYYHLNLLQRLLCIDIDQQKDLLKYQDHLQRLMYILYQHILMHSQLRLRISQFFSIDTAGSLTQMCEFYSELFDKICKREPNAYMAMLYYDTEMFRRQKKNKQQKKDEEVDYKKKFFKMMKMEEFYAA